MCLVELGISALISNSIGKLLLLSDLIEFFKIHHPINKLLYHVLRECFHQRSHLFRHIIVIVVAYNHCVVAEVNVLSWFSTVLSVFDYFGAEPNHAHRTQSIPFNVSFNTMFIYWKRELDGICLYTPHTTHINIHPLTKGTTNVACACMCVRSEESFSRKCVSLCVRWCACHSVSKSLALLSHALCTH